MNQSGYIEVICGPMFSGKTEELIRRLKRATIAKQSVAVFKSSVDDRYSTTDLVSHSGLSFPYVSVLSSASILELVDGVQVVGIDEAQFFDEGIVAVVETLANSGRRVVVAGLDVDYLAQPFKSMPKLLAVADRVDKLSAVCMECGAEAHRSYLKLDTEKTENQVLIGASESYEARCRHCFVSKKDSYVRT